MEHADARAWYRHVERAPADGDFGNAWGALVTYVWDPCGVLLHSTQLIS